MKVFSLLLLAGFALVNSASGQEMSYYLPKKNLRITVTYTVIGHYKKVRLSNGPDSIVASHHKVFIEDDVTLETVVVPDLNRFFELSLPQKLKSSSAFEWTLAFDKDGMGILNSLNASRITKGSAIATASMGLVTNIISGVTGLRQSRLPSASNASYDDIQEQKIVLSEIIEVPSEGIENYLVTQPRLNLAAKIPKVLISVKPENTKRPVMANTPPEKDRIYSIIPRWYRVIVAIEDNGYLTRGNIIDTSIAFPQHGSLTSISHEDMFKGNRSLVLKLDPDSGQLQAFEYKKRAGLESDAELINRKLSELVTALSELRTEQQEELTRDVKRLELETERLELLQKLQMLESIEGQ